MTKKELFETALAIIGSVGGAGVIITMLSGWLGKVWSQRLMQNEVAKHNEKLAEITSNLKKLETEHQIKFSNIYIKQAEIISEIYSKLFDVNTCRKTLLLELSCREIKESTEREFKQREPWELITGIDTLSQNEQAQIEKFSRSLNDLYLFYGKNRLFLPSSCCDRIDDILNLSFYMSGNYQNVAIKNRDGSLMVNPIVKETWDKSEESIGILFPELESEFRKLVGESS